jgi:hypothetical protein
MYLKYESTHAEMELKYGPTTHFQIDLKFSKNLSLVQFTTIQEKRTR